MDGFFSTDKTPRIETTIQMRKILDVSARYHCYFLCEKHLQINRPNLPLPPSPIPDRVKYGCRNAQKRRQTEELTILLIGEASLLKLLKVIHVDLSFLN